MHNHVFGGKEITKSLGSLSAMRSVCFLAGPRNRISGGHLSARGARLSIRGWENNEEIMVPSAERQETGRRRRGFKTDG